MCRICKPNMQEIRNSSRVLIASIAGHVGGVGGLRVGRIISIRAYALGAGNT